MNTQFHQNSSHRSSSTVFHRRLLALSLSSFAISSAFPLHFHWTIHFCQSSPPIPHLLSIIFSRFSCWRALSCPSPPVKRHVFRFPFAKWSDCRAETSSSGNCSAFCKRSRNEQTDGGGAGDRELAENWGGWLWMKSGGIIETWMLKYGNCFMPTRNWRGNGGTCARECGNRLTQYCTMKSGNILGSIIWGTL